MSMTRVSSFIYAANFKWQCFVYWCLLYSILEKLLQKFIHAVFIFAILYRFIFAILKILKLGQQKIKIICFY